MTRDLRKIFKKIDKSKYPKTVIRWSFSAFIFTPIFIIGNKLWGFMAAYFLVYFYKIFIVRSFLNKFTIILMFCIFAVWFVILVYLLIYGRILAWDKLGYKNNEKNILNFQLRQKNIFFWAIFLSIAEVLVMYFYLTLVGFE